MESVKLRRMLAAKLELEAERKGAPVRRTDAIIVAIAINGNAKLFTLDTEHFKPLEALGLKIF
ncbi:MAG: hypothetical protein KIH01_07960 [Candidatus Freyarchaeota archaeon]|nr:hypothetical protein [Candidatus Jordarchaeia archaeon]